MTKAELKAAWGKYTDTDVLVDKMMALLTKHRHRNSEHGVCVMLDYYFKAKEPLIKLLATSNHYNGDMRIVVRKGFDRDIDRYKVAQFCNSFAKNIQADKFMLKFEDSDGKKLMDYMMTGHKKVNVQDFTAKNFAFENAEKMSQFDLYTGSTKESYDKFTEFNNYMCDFSRLACSQLARDKCENGIDLKKGMKTSRAFNKVCTHYGLNKAHPKKVTTTENGQSVTRTVYPYDQLFAQYADLVSSSNRKLYYVISVNPLDYITMSNGVNWTSCHSAVRTNSAGFGGMACAGCTSYMTDPVSIITFVLDDINGDIHDIGKVYRQMYYYENNMFVQSRIYPQANDGATNLYDRFLVLMQEEMSEPLGVTEDDWGYVKEYGLINNMTKNQGYHYPDAGHNSECGIFYPKSKVSDIRTHKRITIGSMSICPHCGRQMNYRNRLSCPDCQI